ncbi:chloride channel protein [Gloeothece verrucosa]|uniref:Cl-channel voltage-gated family protein n=1 Tax=Gloeothece verrucosa (strain PCC 7822) TaxID=497965 RepID=E0UBU9_GLOV7|nr:chloride channel protein [Gloeothece verrucosa]ADN15164.1 Cl- channel voltage-gated family protein [Gloeothece verrucosa PCC 7822]
MNLPFPLKRLHGWFKARRFGRSSVDTRYAMLESCLIGILSAIAALLLKQGVGWLGGWRVHITTKLGAVWLLPIGGLLLGLLAGQLIQVISPAAAGGGIPQVKAALARFPVPLSLRVAIAKLLGATLVLGAGLTLGRRAPTVHIGAALAAQLSQWVPTSPEHRRQMIAAGAASGLAAGFGTPIAGVLFVVEELMRDVSGLTLETAIVASFTGAVVSLLLESAGPIIPAPLNINFSAREIPLYLLLGFLAGMLGALFNWGILFCMNVQKRLRLPMPWRVGLVCMISGGVIALLPPFFRDNSGLREFLVTGELGWRSILLAFVAHFCLTILAYSSGAPGGLFAPALVLGSALGYIVGELAGWVTGSGAATTYALAGMGGFFTAVVRAPVTAIVIVFELKANFNIVLPLMLTCAVSYLVAENVFSRSIYEHLLDASGIHLSEEVPVNDFLSKLKAADVMQSQVESLESHLTLDKVLQAMSISRHRGFPVVEAGKLVGIVTQSDLSNLGERSPDVSLREIMTPKPITVQPETSLSDVLYLLNRYQLSRLPVTEGHILVGIITRTDIIQAEVKQLGGGTQGTKPPPSYVVYQTRSPALGNGRILLPLSDPEMAATLFQIAATIARHRHYEIECLQVIKIPRHQFPSEARVEVHHSRKLMQRMERLGRHLNIAVHTQVRVAQDTAESIIETIQQRHISLMLMSWKGISDSQGAIFGSVADTLIHKAPCDLMLVKLGASANAYPLNLEHNATWLVPMAGGPNAQRAIELLPSLTRLYSNPDAPQLWLCKVYPPSEIEPDSQGLEEAAQILRDKLNKPIFPISIRSNSVSDALIQLARAEECDVIVLGASREGLLQQAIHGNIPDAIARGVDSTVIVVRGAID